jgi:transposase
MHDWAFRELQEMLAHKASEYGICVEDVPLEFTPSERGRSRCPLHPGV